MSSAAIAGLRLFLWQPQDLKHLSKGCPTRLVMKVVLSHALSHIASLGSSVRHT